MLRGCQQGSFLLSPAAHNVRRKKLGFVALFYVFRYTASYISTLLGAQLVVLEMGKKVEEPRLAWNVGLAQFPIENKPGEKRSLSLSRGSGRRLEEEEKLVFVVIVGEMSILAAAAVWEESTEIYFPFSWRRSKDEDEGGKGTSSTPPPPVLRVYSSLTFTVKHSDATQQ